MSMNNKRLRFTITLAIGSFAGSKNNQVVLEGFRASAEIQKAGGQMMATCAARIYGLEQSLMAQLTTLSFLALSYNKNTMKVEVIDDEQSTLVYEGQIINAWGNYETAPDVFLHIETQAGFYQQVTIDKPLQYNGVADVSQLMQQLANKIGVSFENNGVVAKISNPNYHGSIIDQLRNLANDTRTEFYLDNGVLAICPRGIARKTKQAIPVISDKSGLISYPTFDTVGVTFKCLFNPYIIFGGQIIMQSDVPQANGTWQVCSITHNLESEKPDGQWFSTVRCTSTGLTPL